MNTAQAAELTGSGQGFINRWGIAPAHGDLPQDRGTVE